MASTSASFKRSKYDVFLSYSGEDSDKNFVDHLDHALCQKGIITYRECQTCEKGEKISDDLITSIEDSRFHIIVFSKNYAFSSWCLDQLVKIMDCQKTAEGQTAYPLFYDVDPADVGNQIEAIGKAAAKHDVNDSWSSCLPLDHLCAIIACCCPSSSLSGFTSLADLETEEDVRIWIEALTKASSLAGWELKTTFDGYEAKFIQKIVEDISLKPHFNTSSSQVDLVGMDTRVKSVISALDIDSEVVRMIGIWGMGGSGKTTLAGAVFYHLSSLFEDKCFVENVGYNTRDSLSGLRKLQEQVLVEVLKDEKINVGSVYDGRDKMKRMMGNRKLLLVLDNVDNIYQLEALAGEPSWFKSGSRIIITTRDEQVLRAHRVNYIHNVNLLSYDEAFCLFNRYAFKKGVPIQEYEELSQKVVNYAAGLPLTLKVMGARLYGTPIAYWVVAIEQLEKIPLGITFEVLKRSYDSLDNDQKEILLDVSCILKGEQKDEAIRTLESCGFDAEIVLRVLEQKSLITVSDTDSLQLHDHIEEMSRYIVRGMHPHEPSKHNRLWVKEEIEDILVCESGTEATRSIKLHNTNLHPAIIMQGLRKMKELRCLHVDNEYRESEVDEVSQHLPDTLRSLYWSYCPFQCLPKTFQANNLVNLILKGSNISQLWEGGEVKVLNKLRFLGLMSSKLKTFNLELTPCLERLDLRGCNDFAELIMPVECPKLKYLNLSGSRLSRVNLGMTPNLEVLYLECNVFVELHIPVEGLNLKIFNLSGSKVSNLNLGLNPLLMNFESLEKLTLSIKDIKHLPNSILMLKRLKSLELVSCWLLEQLPKDLGGLKFLEEIHVRDCISLLDIPNNISPIVI